MSLRSTCKKTRYGAVIVNNDIIVGTGYNGAPRGAKNCCDIEGPCPRIAQNIPSGERYELCRAIHSEANAIMNAGREKCVGAVMFIYGLKADDINVSVKAEPCMMCRRLIVNSGITRVIISDGDNGYIVKDVEQMLD